MSSKQERGSTSTAARGRGRPLSLVAQVERASRHRSTSPRGGQTRREQMGQEIRHKGGLSTTDESGGESAARDGIPIDESKFRTENRD